MKTYGVGISGIGWVAGEHIKAFNQNPHMEVKALASRQRQSSQGAKDRLGLDCDILNTYLSHEICLAIDRSIETGTAVRLPLVAD